jgi:hypothetical protein
MSDEVKGASWDFINDAVDSLNADGCQYVLAVGREGFKMTHVFHGVNTAEDGKAFVSALMSMLKEKFPDCKDFQF